MTNKNDNKVLTKRQWIMKVKYESLEKLAKETIKNNYK
jgi:ribosomal protein S24E